MAIEIHFGDDTKTQSIEAGYAIVEDYLYSLLQRDRARLACLKGFLHIVTELLRSRVYAMALDYAAAAD